MRYVKDVIFWDIISILSEKTCLTEICAYAQAPSGESLLFTSGAQSTGRGTLCIRSKEVIMHHTST